MNKKGIAFNEKSITSCVKLLVESAPQYKAEYNIHLQLLCNIWARSPKGRIPHPSITGLKMRPTA